MYSTTCPVACSVDSYEKANRRFRDRPIVGRTRASPATVMNATAHAKARRRRAYTAAKMPTTIARIGRPISTTVAIYVMCSAGGRCCICERRTVYATSKAQARKPSMARTSRQRLTWTSLPPACSPHRLACTLAAPSGELPPTHISMPWCGPAYHTQTAQSPARPPTQMSATPFGN
jgi:hypothetical protein